MKDTRPAGTDGRGYLRHAVELAGILYDLAAVYGKRGLGFRVGLGSICRRGQVSEIHRIVASVAAVLPGIPLHLLGRLVGVICPVRAWGPKLGRHSGLVRAALVFVRREIARRGLGHATIFTEAGVAEVVQRGDIQRASAGC